MRLIPVVILLIFIFDLIDSSAGQGLGTVSAPILIMMGYDPALEVVPSLVIVAAMSGLVSGWFHHEFENVNYSLKRPLNDETKTVAFTAGVGAIMIVCSTLLVHYFIQPPEIFLNTYIAILVIVMGFLGLVRVKGSKKYRFRPKFIVTFAAIAGFNKGVGGGGYGPVLVMGNILSGIYEKTAAALTQTTEGFVSTVGAITFFALAFGVGEIDLFLLPSMFTGSFFASILAPYILRVIPNKIWKFLIPSYSFGIGLYFIVRLFVL